MLATSLTIGGKSYRATPLQSRDEIAWQLEGGAEPYATALCWDAAGVPYYSCDCGDFVWRGRLCKHITALVNARLLPEIQSPAAGTVADSRSGSREPEEPERLDSAPCCGDSISTD